MERLALWAVVALVGSNVMFLVLLEVARRRSLRRRVIDARGRPRG